MTAENPLLGKRFRHKTNSRIITIVSDYYEGPDDHGYVYQFDDDKATHWISTNSLNVNYERIEQ